MNVIKIQKSGAIKPRLAGRFQIDLRFGQTGLQKALFRAF